MAGETWPVTPDAAEVFSSLENFSSVNKTYNNTWNYTDITNLTNVSLQNSSQTATALFSPFNNFWVTTIFGYYIYVILIIVLDLIIFAKTRSLGLTGIATILMSALAIQATSNEIPFEILKYFYLLAVLGIVATLISAFTKDK